MPIAIPTLDPSALPTQPGGILGGILGGMQTQQRMQAQRLATQMTQQRLAMLPQEEQAKLAEAQARTGLYGQQARLAAARAEAGPAVGALTGPAADVRSIERLKVMYGEHSQQVKDAQSGLNAKNARLAAIGKWYGQPQVYKLQQVRQQQLAVGDTRGASETSAAMAKQLSDPKARDQYEALTGIVDEMGNVDMDKISQYAGPMGKTKLFTDQAMANFGHISPEYNAYRNFTFQAKAMADQLRKALGTSVRNQYVKTMLLPLIDNIDKTWGNNPQLARSQWQWANRWLNHYKDLYHMYATQGIPQDQINPKILADKTLLETPPGMQYMRRPVAAGPAVTPTITPAARITAPTDRFAKYTDADWESTAKQHGMTVDELKRRVGAQ